LAAKSTGETININGLISKIRNTIGNNNVVLVEAAGGLMIPIDAHNAMVMVDLIASLRIPIGLWIFSLSNSQFPGLSGPSIAHCVFGSCHHSILLPSRSSMVPSAID
jgi:hypothetical protein